ncbi:insulinase family protein [Novosphingobium sp. ZN18A2]|uniref:M16 family metallopeptidase n=1 Tax=Novosphingobium sp. ZN18A2 TaxID=3079861 RepID=UPI0030CB5B95
MSLFQRAARRFGFFLLPLIAFAAPADAQQQASDSSPAASTVPPQPGSDWLYKGSDVPQDKAWIFGTLPNGLRYAVRHNGVPPDQMSVRVLVDAGSMYETEAQRGYAHLLEHLTFRESKYLKEGETIPTWQRLGATFGSDTNAETSPTQTVYKLDVPDMTPAKLDETFKLLSGMIISPIFTNHGVKTEVPIVLAEKRERAGAQARVADAQRELLFEGQPLADRAPIGTDATLEAASAKSIKTFHDKWYRPDNTIVIVAGDQDPNAMIAEIKQWFGGWKAKGPKPAAPDFGKPQAPANDDAGHPIGTVKVMVEPEMPRILTVAIERPWRKKNDTIVYNQGLMIDRLAMTLINRRLEAKARAGGSFLFASVDSSDASRSANITTISVTPLGDDWKAALRDVREVIADAVDTPPSEAEIKRELAEFDVAFKVPVETQETLAASTVADNLVQAVDIRETVAAPDAVYSIFRKSIPLFTPQAVLDHTRDLFKGTVERAMYVTPKDGEATSAAIKAALVAPVRADGGSRITARNITFSELPAIGTPGKLASAKPAGLLGIETVDLSNGVKALLWPNDAEPGRVIVRVRFGGGYAAIPVKDAVYAQLGDAALIDAGLASLNREDLDQLSTGRKLGLDFSIDDTAFVLSGDTREADLADELYLMAAKIALPDWDPNPVKRAIAAAKIQYDTYNGSAQGMLNRDLQWLLHDRDPRWQTPTPTELDKATPEGFKDAWAPLLKQGPVEVDIFGDFDRDKTIAALEKTFGALAPRDPLPTATLSPNIPAHNEQPVLLTHRGDANQAAAVIAWPTGGGEKGVHISRQLQVLAQIMNNRLFDAMREKVGASYAPQVASTWPLDLPSGGFVAATVQLRPQDMDTFFNAADKIAADLAATPPSKDELERVTEPLKQLITRASTGNGFYMYQLTGGALDPRKLTDIRSILSDFTRITPEQVQVLAETFLVKDRSWRLEVMPAKK